ncbi:hypothetical protein FJT64_003270 [Amphibalanus amphitrite]|uniref:MYND-type domain-containing protein n=1 Tax=Amphibalanus amphitrite TaxID=1232801 RepID=A0A6A4WFM0_AMPAM|nr:hypothetical protein FJT64_003270 [Amphibalanus amphitrite]
MKELVLKEDDGIFDGSFSPDEYHYYTEHKDVVRTMWKEQGRLFWLNAITKFRIHNVKHGNLSPFNTMVSNGALDYPFIVIAKKMTGSFGDVDELLTDISMVMRNMHLAGNMLKPTCAFDPFINTTTRNSFRNLFGPPDTKLRILRTFIFAETYCCWGGTLIRLLPAWKVSPRVRPRPGLWCPPASYTQPTPLRTGVFEQYLRNSCGDELADVCGVPPQRLVWWKSTRPNGATTLPPMEEFSALSVVFDYLMDLAGDVVDEGAGARADGAKARTAPKGVWKAAANLEGIATATTTEKKKRKKKKKGDKSTSDESAKDDEKPEVDKDKTTAAKTGPDKAGANKAGAKPKAPVLEPPPAVVLAPPTFPPLPRPVVDATLDWHEYVTAVVGTKRLVHNQVRGGELQLAWATYIMKDSHESELGHISIDLRDKVKSQLTKMVNYLKSARKALAVKGNNSTIVLRRERDELTARINTCNTLLSAVLTLRYNPGPDPVADLIRIRDATKHELQDLLRICPLVYQYSVAEHVFGYSRIVYVDLSRIRYLMRKGLALVGSAPPKTQDEASTMTMLALEWFPELMMLSKELLAHLVRQTMPGTVIGRRVRDRGAYTFNDDAKVLHAKLADPVTFAAMKRVFGEIRDLTSGKDGVLPPRPVQLRPQTGQSVVDVYWARLGAMLYVTDLLSVIPVSAAANAYTLAFKFSSLDILFDSMIELQLAQWRWLYPRAELELPRRPAFSRAASSQLLTDCLNHVDLVMMGTQRRLAALYQRFKNCNFGKGEGKGDMLYTHCHFPDDTCDVNAHQNPMHCADCLRHARDMANRRLVCGVTHLIRATLWSGCDLGKVFDSLHIMPCFLVAVQDFKASPSKGHREGSIREVMLIACDELGKKISERMMNRVMPYRPHEYEPMLQMAAKELRLEAEVEYDSGWMAQGPLPPMPPQRLQLTPTWPALLTGANQDTLDWRRCVADPAGAVRTLSVKGRRAPDDMAKEACTQRTGGPEATDAACAHDHAGKMQCSVLKTLRDIRFGIHVLQGCTEPGVISIHASMVNVLRECWLPYLLSVDRVFRGRPATDPRYAQHNVVLDGCRAWLETNLTSLYKQRSKVGSGRMLRFDRSWMKADALLKPDSTLCRTVSFSQACDMHLDMMKRLMDVLVLVRTRLPPIVEKGCEVHPAPLELLERMETGAVLLLKPFIAYRDGKQSRHLVDVSELDPQVALALDIYGWLGLVKGMVESAADILEPYTAPSEQLTEVTNRALKAYSNALRGGSLIEFLALRPAHAVPLQLAVTAHLRRDAASLNAVITHAGEKTCTPQFIAMPTIASIAACSMTDVWKIPDEWLVRLHQVRRVLLSTPRPHLLDSTLVQLDYQLDCAAEQLPDLPTFDGPEDMSGAGMFTTGLEVNSMKFADHMVELTEHVLNYHAAMKTAFYLSHNGHVFPDRRFFVKPSNPASASKPEPVFPYGKWPPYGTDSEPTVLTDGNSKTTPETDKDAKGDGSPASSISTQIGGIPAASRATSQDGTQSEVMKWAAANIVKVRRGASRSGGPAAGGASGPPMETVQGKPADPAVTAMERLSRELENLLLSADHLRDIPEEPLEPAQLERVGRRAGRLSDGVQQLPEGPLRDAAVQLVSCVQGAVAPPPVSKRSRKRAAKKARPIAGSDMSVVETCLAKLTSVLTERGVPVAESPTPEPSSDSEEPDEADAAALRSCSFCERRERTPGAFELCSLCVADEVSSPRAYCGKACQTDDWEVGHWEDHN